MLPIIGRRMRTTFENVCILTKSATVYFGETVRFLRRIKAITASLTYKFDGVFTVSRVISLTIYELVDESDESVGCVDLRPQALSRDRCL